MVTLVLLPGMDGTGRLFDAFVAELSPEIKVRVVSYPVDQPDGYAELIAFARKELPAGEPYFILGESFSGPIAIALAAETPAQLKGLILCCTFARCPRPRLSALSPLLSVMPLSWTPVSLMGRPLLGRFFTSALASALAAAIKPVSSVALRARLRAVASVDVSSLLATVTVPILCLRASQDGLVPASAAAQIAALNPRCHEVALDGPHFLLQANPKEAAQAVSAFIQNNAQIEAGRQFMQEFHDAFRELAK
ncbi:MAG TPA: alpha/beta fold hydrolase [Burkholderiaceae bacterium]|jgi:pimeloyl-ACP methyl ester carboxylesterase